MAFQQSRAVDTGDDATFAARFRERWGAPKLNAIQAAEFDLRLEARHKSGHGRVRLGPAALGAAVVASMIAVVVIDRGAGQDDEDAFSSLADAESFALSSVGIADESEDKVAYDEVSNRLWAALDDDETSGLSESLSYEYRVLAAWIFPSDQVFSTNDEQ